MLATRSCKSCADLALQRPLNRLTAYWPEYVDICHTLRRRLSGWHRLVPKRNLLMVIIDGAIA
jgi:hypothetical protein